MNSRLNDNTTTVIEHTPDVLETVHRQIIDLGFEAKCPLSQISSTVSATYILKNWVLRINISDQQRGTYDFDLYKNDGNIPQGETDLLPEEIVPKLTNFIGQEGHEYPSSTNTPPDPIRSIKLNAIEYKTRELVEAAISATVNTARGQREEIAFGTGDGPIEAICRAIDALGPRHDAQFTLLSVHSRGSGYDSCAEAKVVLTSGQRTYEGISVAYDVVRASVEAYVIAINSALSASYKNV